MKPLRKEISAACSNLLDESIYQQLRSSIHEFYGMRLRDTVVSNVTITDAIL